MCTFSPMGNLDLISACTFKFQVAYKMHVSIFIQFKGTAQCSKQADVSVHICRIRTSISIITPAGQFWKVTDPQESLHHFSLDFGCSHSLPYLPKDHLKFEDQVLYSSSYTVIQRNAFLHLQQLVPASTANASAKSLKMNLLVFVYSQVGRLVQDSPKMSDVQTNMQLTAWPGWM